MFFGQISKIGTQKTDEENGIEIVIPVKSDDYSEFYNKATKLYKYFKVIPNVRGANQEQLKDDLKRDEIAKRAQQFIDLTQVEINL